MFGAEFSDSAILEVLGEYSVHIVIQCLALLYRGLPCQTKKKDLDLDPRIHSAMSELSLNFNKESTRGSSNKWTAKTLYQNYLHRNANF